MSTKRSRRTRGKITQNSGGTVNAKSLQNLNPFPPGVSGNPGGRPKYAAFSAACRSILSSPLPADPQSTYAEGIAQKLAQAALRGSVAAAAELAD
jgi:hypothetical protein